LNRRERRTKKTDLTGENHEKKAMLLVPSTEIQMKEEKKVGLQQKTESEDFLETLTSASVVMEKTRAQWAAEKLTMGR